MVGGKIWRTAICGNRKAMGNLIYYIGHKLWRGTEFVGYILCGNRNRLLRAGRESGKDSGRWEMC